MASLPASYFCIKAFSETDMTEDLKKINVPTLILHGDDDQIVPIADSAMLSAKLVKNAELKVYKGAPHGMCTTEKKGQSRPPRVHRTQGSTTRRVKGTFTRESRGRNFQGGVESEFTRICQIS